MPSSLILGHARCDLHKVLSERTFHGKEVRVLVDHMEHREMKHLRGKPEVWCTEGAYLNILLLWFKQCRDKGNRGLVAYT